MIRCEWDPANGTLWSLNSPGCREAATVVTGSKIYLCAKCASLPMFAKARKTPLAPYADVSTDFLDGAKIMRESIASKVESLGFNEIADTVRRMPLPGQDH